MAVTETTAKTRGEGPVAITYIDSEGKNDHKRVPAKVSGVVITARKDGASKSYNLAELPEDVKNGLVAFALATRAKTYINNHADGPEDVIKLADQVYSDFQAGKMYTRAEGGKAPGKKFDATIYVEAAKLAYAAMAKKKMVYKSSGKPIVPMSEQDVADLTTKYESMSPKDRTDFTRKMKKNAFFDKALAQLQAQRKTIDSDTEVEELF